MMGVGKHCPNCGATLRTRLGKLECPSCGHVAPDAPPPTATEKPLDYGGIHRTQLLSPAPAAPPPAEGMPRFFGDTSWEAASRSVPVFKQEPAALHREKLAYLAVEATVGLLCSFGGFLPSLGGSVETGIPELLGGMFATAIGLVILWFALFGGMPPLKWGCMLTTALSVLGLLVLGIVGGSVLSSDAYGINLAKYGVNDTVAALAGVALLVSAGIRTWLVLLLWRDLRSSDQ
jgi:hypothetical protein